MACTRELPVNDEDLRHMNREDRLRELLRDPRWSLAPWPDAHSRVRRAGPWRKRGGAWGGGGGGGKNLPGASGGRGLGPTYPLRGVAGPPPAGGGRAGDPGAIP